MRSRKTCPTFSSRLDWPRNVSLTSKRNRWEQCWRYMLFKDAKLLQLELNRKLKNSTSSSNLCPFLISWLTRAIWRLLLIWFKMQATWLKKNLKMLMSAKVSRKVSLTLSLDALKNWIASVYTLSCSGSTPKSSLCHPPIAQMILSKSLKTDSATTSNLRQSS